MVRKCFDRVLGSVFEGLVKTTIRHFVRQTRDDSAANHGEVIGDQQTRYRVLQTSSEASIWVSVSPLRVSGSDI